MKNHPTLNLEAIVLACYRIWGGRCPRCSSKEPYYRDCPVCDAYVIGCDVAKKEDVLVKYIAWLKSEQTL